MAASPADVHVEPEPDTDILEAADQGSTAGSRHASGSPSVRHGSVGSPSRHGSGSPGRHTSGASVGSPGQYTSGARQESGASTVVRFASSGVASGQQPPPQQQQQRQAPESLDEAEAVMTPPPDPTISPSHSVSRAPLARGRAPSQDETTLARMGLRDLCEYALDHGFPLEEVNVCGNKTELLQLLLPRQADSSAGLAGTDLEAARPPFGSVAALMVTVFVDYLGLFISLPILPFLVLDLGGSVDDIGIIMAGYSAAQLLSMIWMPMLSDKIGRTPVVIMSNLGSCLGYMLVGGSNKVWMLYAFRALGGMFAGTMGVAQAFLADIVPGPMLPQYQGYMTGALFVGLAFGPSIAGSVSTFGNNIPFYVAGVMAGLSTLNSVFFLKAPPKQKEDKGPVRTTSGREVARSETPMPSVIYMIAFTRFLCMFTVRAQGSVVAVHLQDIRGWGAVEVSFLYIGLAILQIGFQALAYRKMYQKISLAGVSVVGTIACSVAAFFLDPLSRIDGAAGTILFTTVYEVFMLGGVAALLPLSALCGVLAPKEKRGKASSIDMAAGAAGQVVGSLATPAVWQQSTYMSFALCGIAQLIACACAVSLATRFKASKGLGKAVKQADARMEAFDDGHYDYKEERRFLDELRAFVGDQLRVKNYYPGHPDRIRRNVTQTAVKLMISDALPAWAQYGSDERLAQAEHLGHRQPHLRHAVERVRQGEDPASVLSTYLHH